MSLHGKCALITGSSDGLGLEMGRALLHAGCAVMLHGLKPRAEMEPTLAALSAARFGNVSYAQADLSDPRAIESLIRSARLLTGSVDILINNAVVRHFAAVESLPLERWQESLAVNLTAPLHCIQLILPDMRSHAWGRIFNMTSVYGSRAAANRVGYVTTKTALLGLTRSVALETLGQGITCNAICPGSVQTPNIDARIGELMQSQRLGREDAVREFLKGKQPTGTLIEARHIAELVVFLCGESASQITGAMLPIDGGWLAS
jgi:3-hydroxybutyrate dehydrogenase